jgi:hypothetical protein
MGELKIRNGQLGMRFGTQSLSQISTRFVTEYRSQPRNMWFSLNVILSQIFTKFVTKYKNNKVCKALKNK